MAELLSPRRRGGGHLPEAALQGGGDGPRSGRWRHPASACAQREYAMLRTRTGGSAPSGESLIPVDRPLREGSQARQRWAAARSSTMDFHRSAPESWLEARLIPGLSGLLLPLLVLVLAALT